MRSMDGLRDGREEAVTECREREAGSARTTAGRSCEAATDMRSMDGLRDGREEAVTEYRGPAKRIYKTAKRALWVDF